MVVGATFDRSLMRRFGDAMGMEYYKKGINVALLPVAGPLGRVARGGRNWEGFGADPYLRYIQELNSHRVQMLTISVAQEWRQSPLVFKNKALLFSPSTGCSTNR
jgi:hypothetical protein